MAVIGMFLTVNRSTGQTRQTHHTENEITSIYKVKIVLKCLICLLSSGLASLICKASFILRVEEYLAESRTLKQESV